MGLGNHPISVIYPSTREPMYGAPKATVSASAGLHEMNALDNAGDK